TKGVYDVLLDSAEPHEVILKTEFERLDLLPSSMDLVGAEMELIDLPDRAQRLALALEPLLPDYQYILIDAPPSLGLLTLNVLVFARQVLVPVQSEYFALEGLSALTQTIDRVRRAHNPDLSLLGLVVTMFDARTNLSQQVEEEVRRVFGEQVFQAVIHRSVKLSEASSFGKPIIFYDFRSRGSLNYMQLCQEVVHACEKTRLGTGA
ncbi:ParA family protein, partial [bacterium]|nr:ParA family protein [bacterium]